MNKRIWELAEQQGLTGPNYLISSNELEKFAELIVRECMEQGKQIQLQTVSNGSKDYVDDREMGIEVFMNQIKKHLGVEK